jgi:hypothetical protein
MDLLLDELFDGLRLRPLKRVSHVSGLVSSRFRQGCSDQRRFLSLEETQKKSEAWPGLANGQLPHSSLAYRSPAEHLSGRRPWSSGMPGFEGIYEGRKQKGRTRSALPLRPSSVAALGCSLAWSYHSGDRQADYTSAPINGKTRNFLTRIGPAKGHAQTSRISSVVLKGGHSRTSIINSRCQSEVFALIPR